MRALNNKIVVVTGATSGIGKEISRQLVAEGATVYLIGRDFTSIQKDLFFLKAYNTDNVFFLKCDLSQTTELDILIHELDKIEHIDALVHSAGIISIGAVQNESIENLDRQYAVNVRAAYYITQKLLARLRKATGDIVFINSTAGIDSWEEVGQYASTKFAARAIADSLRKELKNDRVRVCSLYLGSVDTPMQEKINQMTGFEVRSKDSMMSPGAIADIVLYLLKLPQEATVTDITIRQNF